MRPETHRRRLARSVDDIVDIHRLQDWRAQVAELLDLLEKLHDAAAFIDDEVGQLKIALLEVHRQKLRRARDPRERVLDLVRQHLGHADRRFRRLAGMGVVAHPSGNLARRDHHEHLALGPQKRGHLNIALNRRALARADIHIVDIKRGAPRTGAGEGLFQGRVDHHLVPDRLTDQGAGGEVEKALGGRIDHFDTIVLVEKQRRNRQRRPKGGIGVHAAALSQPASASGKRLRTRAGLASTSTAFRSGAGVAASSIYQPRCLRATLLPSAAP